MPRAILTLCFVIEQRVNCEPGLTLLQNREPGRRRCREEWWEQGKLNARGEVLQAVASRERFIIIVIINDPHTDSRQTEQRKKPHARPSLLSILFSIFRSLAVIHEHVKSLRTLLPRSEPFLLPLPRLATSFRMQGHSFLSFPSISALHLHIFCVFVFRCSLSPDRD